MKGAVHGQQQEQRQHWLYGILLISKVILCAVDFCVHPLRDRNYVFVNSGGGIRGGGDGGWAI